VNIVEKEELEKVDLVLLMLEGQTKELLRGLGEARKRLRKVIDDAKD